jgi:Mitochondrial small ribosomal subunit Rsm22
MSSAGRESRCLPPDPPQSGRMEYDWSSLDELRTTYLEGTAGKGDYWATDELLSGYDVTFARRIAWKWHHVFRDLARLGWTPPAGAVYDWGCGTGVAAREFLTAFPDAGLTSVGLHDRSRRAMNFASAAVRREFPEIPAATSEPEGPFTLLISHVLTELPAAALNELLKIAARASAILWVEPGTSAASRQLVQAREQLRADFHPIAPCLHRHGCGLLAAGHEKDWCHFFATPPPEVYTDRDWVQFGRIMGIDLRSLPLSYLVLDRRPPNDPVPGAVRILGKHRLYKGHALLDACNATGVHERRFTKRTAPVFFRAMTKGKTSTLQQWTLTENEITSLTEPGAPAGQD